MFPKQKIKNGIATMGSRIELDVLENVSMSQADQVHVLCDLNVLGDIKK